MKYGRARYHEGTYKLGKDHSECKNFQWKWTYLKGFLKKYKYRQHPP